MYETISMIMKTSVRSLFFRIKAEINVRAKADKKITVVKKRLGLNIIRHWRLKPIRNPDPAIEMPIEREKHIANVSGRPVTIFSTENQARMSKTILISMQAPKATKRSVIVREGKNEPLVSCSSETGK
jgi:hypothetical protein